MSRVKIKFPDEKPLFSCSISVRIGDINYGNHLGNDSVLSIIHEARMQLLKSWGGNELDIKNNSLIMADVMISYRGEAFYGDKLNVGIYADDITDRSFDLLYHMSAEQNGQVKDIAHAKTGMLCFDYSTRKIALMNEELKTLLKGGVF
ncbi:MAG: thioesterase family protein [Bacteroidetes bacterium]|nr:thioesterase family protein [Bacteroidota bacterium]